VRVLLCVGLLGAGARAEEAVELTEEVESFVLDFSAPSTCPPQSVFEELAQSLTAEARFHATPTGEEVRLLTIKIEKRQSDYFGRLVLVEGAARAAREFDAQTCAEVVEALALATALAIDPEALGDGVDQGGKKAGGPASEPAPAPATPAKGGAEGDAPSAARDEQKHALVLGIEGALSFPRVEEASASGAAGLEPRALTKLSVGLYAEYETQALGFASSVYAGVSYAGASATEVALKWVPDGHVGLCPVWWVPGAAARFAPCVGAHGGNLRADQEQTAYQFDGGMDALARLQLVSSALRVTVSGGVSVPVRFISYYLYAADPSEDEELLRLSPRVHPQVSVAVGGALF
jgi:hypothetical protein